MKNIIKFYLLTFLFIASPLFAVEGIAVINIQEAILKTQTANDAFKALDEDPDFSANMEQAQTLQADMQAIAEKLQKEQETLSQEEIALIRQNPTGEHKRWVCSPYWAKLKIYKTEGPVANYITLTGNGREVELGSFLSEDERKTLYEELERLLDGYKATNTN